MPKRTIFSIGFYIPNEEVENLPFDSERSLLDADLIIFMPQGEFFSSDFYQGKPLLSEMRSFKLKAIVSHWKRELFTAFEDGKTIIVILSKPQDYFIYTGQKEFSGTGRNRQTTNLVAPLSTYETLPVHFNELSVKEGKTIRLIEGAKILNSYWRDFGECSKYEVYFEGDFSQNLLKTKTGNKIVGALSKGRGSILLLPNLDITKCYDYNPEPEEDDYDDDEEEGWTEDDIEFGNKLVYHFIEIDKYLTSESESTPVPSWAQEQTYLTKTELAIASEISRINAEAQALTEKVISLETDLLEVSKLRRLLFEQGEELEYAILDALRLLGFTAEGFDDGKSEFDAVFVSPEGRFLGEAEGKDNKWINVDKLSQLERNIQEDFNRDDVTEYAKGVLFGNAYRLMPLEERKEYFTEKCTIGAKRAKVALVRTPDLFEVARYLRDNEDEKFAEMCRKAIASTEGELVDFPSVPLTD